MLALALAGFFTVILAVFVGGGWLLLRSPSTSVPLTVSRQAMSAAPDPSDVPQWAGMLSLLGESVGKGDSHDGMRKLLREAGLRGQSALPILRGAKIASGAVLAVVMTGLVLSSNGDIFSALVVGALGSVVGARGPEWYLRKRAKKRTEAIGLGLPDFLDLLVISVESGVSLNQAFADTARDLRPLHPVIADELGVMEVEIRTGASRSDALRNLGTRSREPELKKLTSLLIQAERFGSSVGKVLRTQARYMRTRRKQKAEEMAHKVSVKMIFPIFLLIMPVVFLVTAGPAVFMLFQNFSKIMR